MTKDFWKDVKLRLSFRWVTYQQNNESYDFSKL